MRNFAKPPAGLVVFCSLAMLPCAAQTISRVSGNGQLVRPTGVNKTNEPLVAVVRDAAGNPLVNWPVTWNVDEKQGLLNGCETRTSSPRYSDGDKRELLDPGGKASCWFQAFSSIGTAWYQQSVVTASAMTADGSAVASKAEFFVTTVNVSNTGVIYGQRELIYPIPSGGTVLAGSAGTVHSPPIQVYMAANGQPIANVGVRLVIEPNEFTGELPLATIQCREPEGIALTDETGIATCHPVFGGKAGIGKYTIVVGGAGYQDSPGWRFEVFPGSPATIQILSGDNQAPGNPGTELLGTLLARVLDAGQNPLADVPATWTPVEPNCLTVVSATRASDQYGQVSARVRLGNAPATCRLRLTAGVSGATAETFFTVRIRGASVGLNKVGGDNQQAVTGAAFGLPLVVELLDSGKPLAGAAVKFAVTTGDAVLLTPDVVTDLQGRASTTVRAGTAAGSIVVRASAAGQGLDFMLTQVPPVIGGGTSPTGLAVTNYPAYVPGREGRKLAPCSLVTIRVPGGTLEALVPAPSLEWPRSTPYVLAGVSVRFQGLSAPVYQIADSGGQRYASVQVPCSVPLGPAALTLSVRGRADVADSVDIVPVAPVILTSPGSDGVLRATAVKANGEVASRENPVERGEHLRVFVTGLGQTSPLLTTNRLGTEELVGTPVIKVAGQSARVISAKYAKNLVGIYELEFEVPSTSGWGDASLTVETGTGSGYERSETKVYIKSIF